MLLLSLWNYLKGYVVILVKGLFIERFINICSIRQIFLWDIKHSKDGSLILKTSIKGFKMIRPAARKSMTKVTTIRKRGMPFILKRLTRRKAYAAGLLIFFLLINLLASFIWSIEVIGCEQLDPDNIKSQLYRHGIKPGIFKYGVDTDRIANIMMLEMKDLSWISIAVVGTKFKVWLKESTRPPELVPIGTPCNVLAGKDGMVESMVIKIGKAAVAEGDTVKEGQVLISGVLEQVGSGTETRLVHAMGEVRARTWYEEIIPLRYRYVERIKTGRQKSIVKIRLFGFDALVFGGKVEYDEYEIDEKHDYLALGENIVLPFEKIKMNVYEMQNSVRELTFDEAQDIAVAEATAAFDEKVPDSASIVKKDIYCIDDSGDGVIEAIRAVCECIEDIGVTREIGGN